MKCAESLFLLSTYVAQHPTWEKEPQLSTKILWDSFLYQLPRLGSAVHTHPSPIFKEMNVPRLFLHLLLCLHRNKYGYFRRLLHFYVYNRWFLGIFRPALHRKNTLWHSKPLLFLLKERMYIVIYPVLNQLCPCLKSVFTTTPCKSPHKCKQNHGSWRLTSKQRYKFPAFLLRRKVVLHSHEFTSQNTGNTSQALVKYLRYISTNSVSWQPSYFYAALSLWHTEQWYWAGIKCISILEQARKSATSFTLFKVNCFT